MATADGRCATSLLRSAASSIIIGTTRKGGVSMQLILIIVLVGMLVDKATRSTWQIRLTTGCGC